jgi:hypothetical protein
MANASRCILFTLEVLMSILASFQVVLVNPQQLCLLLVVLHVIISDVLSLSRVYVLVPPYIPLP